MKNKTYKSYFKKNKLEEKLNYQYNNKMYDLLDQLVLIMWPREGRQLQQLVNTIDDDNVSDLYYKLKDDIKEALIGSISRYYTPFQRD